MKEFGVTSWITPRNTAEYIGITEAELARDRMREQPGISFVRIMGEVRYSDRELDAFLRRVRREG